MCWIPLQPGPQSHCWIFAHNHISTETPHKRAHITGCKTPTITFLSPNQNAYNHIFVAKIVHMCWIPPQSQVVEDNDNLDRFSTERSGSNEIKSVSVCTLSILRHQCILCITPESVIENRLMWLQLSIMPKEDRLKQKRELQRVRRALLNPDVRRNEQTNDTEIRRVETSGHYS